jgi:four helix bundle protein
MQRAESRGPRAETTTAPGRPTFRFERLDVWAVAVKYADAVYALTRSFPANEQFGLTSQMRRSAVSVSANIAEGCSRSTDKDFARFIEISYGSLMENLSEAFVARDQQFVSEEAFRKLYGDAEKLARMLSGLRSSLLKSKP